MALMTRPAPVSRGIGLRVRREDIRFRPLADGRIRIEITVRNESGSRSAPTPLRLQTAEFGAFVPPRDLVTIAVAPLEPDESREIVVHADRDAWPGRGLVTADQDADGIVDGNSSLTSSASSGPDPAIAQQGLEDLAPSTRTFQKLMGSGEVYFAANLNVLIGRQDVERHMTTPLRMRPGVSNLALMKVGERPDEYAYRIQGGDERWAAGLLRGGRPLVLGSRERPVWHRHGRLCLLLVLRPPADATEGTLEVHVSQRSSGREAIVEFSFDARAAGPGCYAV